MYPLDPLFAVVIYIIAFAVGYVLQKSYKLTQARGRYECIDGMRGFLALGVFIHHSGAWGQNFLAGTWDLSVSNLYNQFGQTSVALFFMITSFLFVSKLFDSQGKQFNWNSFFISRVFRLVPMFYFSIILIVVTVMYISNWKLNVSLADFFVSLFHWCFFTIYSTADVNGIGYASMVNGGVQWSLWYEWLFYFSLPLLSILILKKIPGIQYIVLSVVFIIIFFIARDIKAYHIYCFIGGAVPVLLLRFTSFHTKIKEVYKSILLLLCLILIVQFNTVDNIYCILLITLVFTLVAMGNSVFGILKHPVLKLLGEICYSTYLLHSILLFLVFHFGFSFEKMRLMKPLEYCIVIFSITPALVIFSFFCYKYVEKPFIDKGKKMIRQV
ncbi:MAG: acyltransferase [Bacteroidia bacterium]|jgi:peptidoglycan/LPS O-acetylase OafA/YrhL